MDKIKQRMKKIEILSTVLFIIILISFSTYVINEHENIFIGMYKIVTSPAILVTDFIHPCVSFVFCNTFFLCFFS